MTKIYIEKLPDVKLPFYASADSAGMDIYLREALVLRPGEKKIVKTGFRLAIPEGTELELRPRSGLSLKTHLKIANSPGTIDADYRDEVGVIVENSFTYSRLIDEIIMNPNRVFELDDSYERRSASVPGLGELPIYLDKNGNPYGTIYLEAGERICQILLKSYIRAEFSEVENVRLIGRNRGGGFGSSGRK